MNNEYIKYLNLCDTIIDYKAISQKEKSRLLDLVYDSIDIFNEYAEAIMKNGLFSKVFKGSDKLIASIEADVIRNFNRTAAQLLLLNQLCDEFGCELIFTGDLNNQAEVEQFVENIRIAILSSVPDMCY